jgi:hypothetical protein
MTADPDTLPCGCMGKTSLDGVVHPARRRVRGPLARAGVYLGGALECGLVPRRMALDRTEARVVLDGDNDVRRTDTGDASNPVPAWGLVSVLAAPATGTGVSAFANALRRGYGALATGGRLVVAKGHSVQVAGTDQTTFAGDLLRPRGERRPGYVAGNIDVVHAFPNLDPATQAAVASEHALNDCYAYGGTNERVLRPVIGVPGTADAPTATTVQQWYCDDLPGGVALLPPTVFRHGGRGWLFGATATAELAHVPPVHAGRVEPGDAVLLHRPLGAVAALSAPRDDGDDAVRERAVSVLRADHADVGEVIASLSPVNGAGFDPDRHLKLATDVSGPGIGGVVDAVSGDGRRLHIESLPFVDRGAVAQARRQWLIPDATVGTNGPVAMVGRPEAIARAEARLRERGADPVRLGRVEAGSSGVSTADDVRLDRFVEDATLLRSAAGRDTPIPNDD